MGMFFKREKNRDRINAAIKASLQSHLANAVMETPPGDFAAASSLADDLAGPAAEAATELAMQAPPVEFQLKPFLFAFGIFILLLAIAIAVDWLDMVDDPKIYSAMVTTVLGMVLGFFSGDATGTASSR